MNVSIENTSGIPTLVWVVGVVILAAVVLYAIRHGHNVKIGPIEFEVKNKKHELTPYGREGPSSRYHERAGL